MFPCEFFWQRSRFVWRRDLANSIYGVKFLSFWGIIVTVALPVHERQTYSDGDNLSNSFVAYRLMGGLGNQLFQFAAASALANENHCQLYYDDRALEDIRKGKRFSARSENALAGFEGLSFGDRLPDHLDDGYHAWGLSRARNMILTIKANVQKKRSALMLRERKYEFVHFDATLGGSCYLLGNWQSYKYFGEDKDLIKQIEIAFRKAATQGQQSIKNPRDWVGLHVRRGDFVGSTKHREVAHDYYFKARANLRNRKQLLVFSDDPLWCQQNLDLPKDAAFAADLNLTDIQELGLMSQCGGVITANSTYSWWAGFICAAGGGTVYCPSLWFQDGRNEKDLVPIEWHRIEY